MTGVCTPTKFIVGVEFYKYHKPSLFPPSPESQEVNIYEHTTNYNS